MRELPKEGRHRVVIARVSPEIDSGRFAIKRILGDKVIVEADVFADGNATWKSEFQQIRTFRSICLSAHS